MQNLRSEALTENAQLELYAQGIELVFGRKVMALLADIGRSVNVQPMGMHEVHLNQMNLNQFF
jgi:hypothetical protein